MKTKRAIFSFIIVFFTLGSFSTTSAIVAPKEAIRSTIDAILNTLKDEKAALPEKSTKRRERIKALIRERFDFEEMARRSLARHWRKRTSEEKKEFVSLFSQLLEASYIGKIEAYTDEKITYDKEKLKGNGKYAVVSTTIITKDVTIPIDYKVIRKGDKWWVYDVLIEGVSFISTYRSQYNRIILRESYDSLVQKMKTKLNEVNTLLESQQRP